MNSALLIDSSVWVEVSRKNGDESLKAELAELLRAGRTAIVALSTTYGVSTMRSAGKPVEAIKRSPAEPGTTITSAAR